MDPAMDARLEAILSTLEGMRIAIEGWRRNTSSNADHFEAQMRVLVEEVRGLKKEIT